MDSIVGLSRGREEFESRLAQVGADQWELSSPCTDWTVRDLVRHVMAGNRMSITLLAGGTRDEALAEFAAGFEPGVDEFADFRDLADRMHEAFAADGALTGTVDHPMGELPNEQFVGFRIHEYVVHGWDLARATGGVEKFPADLVARVWDDIQPVAPMVTELGIFGPGPSGTINADAPLQTRLLDLIGRRP